MLVGLVYGYWQLGDNWVLGDNWLLLSPEHSLLASGVLSRLYIAIGLLVVLPIVMIAAVLIRRGADAAKTILALIALIVGAVVVLYVTYLVQMAGG